MALIPPAAGAEAIARTVVDAAPAIAFDEAALAPVAFDRWLGDAPASPVEAAIALDRAFNIIYSSGTTGWPRASCSRIR